MSTSGDFVTTEEAAATLGVTVQHVRRLIDNGDLVRVARGLVDSTSLDRYQRSGRGGRTRVWAEHTAWAAIALLSGINPDWLGVAQASRLRGLLREISAPGFVARTHRRADIHVYLAHPSALGRISRDLVTTDPMRLGLVEGVGYNGIPLSGLSERDAAGRLNGYYATENLAWAVRHFALRDDPAGNLTIRTTGFDLAVIRELAVTEMPVLAAVDAAAALDPRERGMGLLALRTALEAYAT
jgi:hypothetical protein